MDAANYALASYLARTGRNVHLVAFRVATELAEYKNVSVHIVPKPANAYLLGGPLLACAGLFHSMRLGTRVLANGGNCPVRGVNWVHYLHAAFEATTASSGLLRMKHHALRTINRATERRAIHAAKIVIANSMLTRNHVIDRLGVSPERVRVVYYGVDSIRFEPPTDGERDSARRALGWRNNRPKVAFVGALGDRRKGFDVLFEAWIRLCGDPHWDADLVVVGTGEELPHWKARTAQAGLETRIQFLGFRGDVPQILKACDALVAPTRYEAYGLGVHEAICCGLPAIVSATSGVAERYPASLRWLLLQDPNDAGELVSKLREWEKKRELVAEDSKAFATSLRARTWDDMARDIDAIFDEADSQ